MGFLKRLLGRESDINPAEDTVAGRPEVTREDWERAARAVPPSEASPEPAADIAPELPASSVLEATSEPDPQPEPAFESAGDDPSDTVGEAPTLPAPQVEARDQARAKQAGGRADVPIAAPAAGGKKPQETEKALRQALDELHGVVNRARGHVEQMARIEDQARTAAARDARASRPAPTQQERPQPSSEMPNAQTAADSASALLLQYMKHFFDLVAMENALFERRLEMLERTFDRIDSRLLAQPVEVSARSSLPDGVQLPLVGGAATAGSPAAPVASPDPPLKQWRVPAQTEETGAHRLWSPPSADDQQRSAAAENPQSATETFVTISGLSTFRMLAVVRDGLRQGDPILAAEPSHFEAGVAEIRLRSTRPVGADEIQSWLSVATGRAVKSAGNHQFELITMRESQ
ncbi:MAG: hypothetical protein GEU28_06440 [Dehalococcoidia bacterium]|nr:hypothetical protein [Dehalococcoidia bacterium]